MSYNEQALAHHGIKGQKWGRRRFQNADGSLTPAGRQRYDDSQDDGSFKSRVKKAAGEIGAAAKQTVGKVGASAKKAAQNFESTELAKRGKSAIDVLMNGDTDWMGNHSYSDDAVTEMRNRGKAAMERLMYSQEQIDNKKFFGRYDF